MKNKTVKLAFMKSLPVLAGYIVLGIGFGILLSKAGYGPLWAFAMSVLIYGGSMQYVGVDLISGGVSILMTAVTTIMVNARHLFYSISMLRVYKDSGKYKPYLIFSLTDETYSLLCDGNTPEGAEPEKYRFLVSLFNHSYWIIGGVIGNLLGSVLPFSSRGIEFSMTALFISAFVEQWITMKDHIPAISGIACTLISLLIFGPENFLIPAMLLITLTLSLLRGRLDGKEEMK
ncbi:MAG: AzlC family ABC transporter permease [Oscillospiraceae bacterium]|nr:AzlC family ABC transporter permease [Oscillospiraceae bacterium]